MSEIERVTKNIDMIIKSISQKGVQDSSISLALICQGTIEIAEELAILNDYLKGKTENEQCESRASASD